MRTNLATDRILSPAETRAFMARMAMHRSLDQETQRKLDALTALQQAALLMMHESHVKRVLIARLLENNPLKPSSLEFRMLRRMGLAEYIPGKRFHDLSPEGRIAAAQLERQLCKGMSIHLLQETGHDRFTVRFSCPCGWHTSIEKGSFVQSYAQKAFTKHIEQMKAGVS